MEFGETLPSILLVDDSSSLRELTAQSLRDHGFDVTIAGGGAEALALMEREPERFDLIVTDFAMPLVSGLDVVRFARSLRADWPAIIITGYADAAAIVDRPADVPLLNKPFLERELLKSILATTTSRRRHGGAVTARFETPRRRLRAAAAMVVSGTYREDDTFDWQACSCYVLTGSEVRVYQDERCVAQRGFAEPEYRALARRSRSSLLPCRTPAPRPRSHGASPGLRRPG